MTTINEKGKLEPTLSEILLNIPKQKIEKWAHLERVIEVGRKEGFGNIATRKKIWPLLLEVNFEKLKQQDSNWRLSEGLHSTDYDQLKKDAMRSFFSLKEFQGIGEEELKKKQSELLEVLDAFAVNEPQYKYFQGFHDIATIFIGVFGAERAYHMSHRLATTYLRDPFLFSFEETVTVLDKLIYEIVTQQDQDFVEVFQEFEDKRLSFTMPWIITWFAHSFEDMDIIARIWDFLLSSRASSIVYLSAALIIYSKANLHQFCINNGSSISDMGMIHCFFQNLRKEKINIQEIITLAISLEERNKLEKLQSYPKLHEETVIREENFLQKSQIYVAINRLEDRKKKIRKFFIYGMSAAGIALMTYLLLPVHDSSPEF